MGYSVTKFHSPKWKACWKISQEGEFNGPGNPNRREILKKNMSSGVTFINVLITSIDKFWITTLQIQIVLFFQATDFLLIYISLKFPSMGSPLLL